MVTRNTKSIFSVGERVLCYEPDPTKAKVLYDSKVLDIIAKGNRRGKKQIEYLIHFHRWNHSWDRYVPEELVLKDTRENRQLQKDLQEKSQHQLKLNRRKVGLHLNYGPGRGGFDDDDNSNTFPDMHDDHDMEPFTSDSDADDEAGADEFTDHFGRSEYSPSPHFDANIEIPPRLKEHLNEDYQLVREQGRLHKLPAQPCVSEILEMAVRDTARNEAAAAAASAGRKTNANAGYSLRGPKKPAPAPSNEVIVELSRRLNLIHEVADGLRIYFDYILGTHLLYKEETGQFLNCDSLRRDERVAMELKMYSALAAKYTVRNSDSDASQSPSHSSVSPAHGDADNCMDEQTTSMVNGLNDRAIDVPLDRSSPIPGTSPKRFKEDKLIPSESGPDPVANAILGAEVVPNETAKPSVESRKCVKSEKSENKQSSVLLKEEQNHNSLDTDNGTREAGGSTPKRDVRRLRSHKTVPVTEVNDEIIEPEPIAEKPSEKPREPTPERVEADISPNAITANVADAVLGPVLELGSAAVTLNEKIMSWRIIPEEGCGFYPCKIYGATHLARLFVKLPDFLNAVKMDEEKLKSLLPRIQIFADYLDDHPEWFGEFNYFEEPTSTAEAPTEVTENV